MGQNHPHLVDDSSEQFLSFGALRNVFDNNDESELSFFLALGPVREGLLFVRQRIGTAGAVVET
jgi:hypothetical protein